MEKFISIILRVLLKRFDWSVYTIIMIIGGSWAIKLSIWGGDNIDKELNLTGGVITLMIAGFFFWKTIGKEIIAEIKKDK